MNTKTQTLSQYYLMATPSNLNGRIEVYKRRYKRELESLMAMIPKEIEHMQDDCYEPSTAVESSLLEVVRYGNRLKALLEVED